MDKETLEGLTSRLEIAVYVLALLGGVIGVSFLYFNRRLQQINKADFIKFQTTSQQSIVQFSALAEAAKADAATAKAHEEESKTERARLELRIREMEQAHSKLAVTNAENEKEVLRLKAAAEPRRIKEIQAAVIAKLLKPFAGQAVSIRLFAQESEASEYMQQIAAVLEQAGLKPERNVMMGAGPARGAGVVVNDAKTAPPLAGAIQHAFSAAGIELPGFVDASAPNGGFFVFVGAKQAPNP
jgi:hypothetical protein